MCQILHHGDVEIETIGDLRRVMPVVVKNVHYSKVALEADDCCLCPVDLIATGAANGFTVIPKQGDFATILHPDSKAPEERRNYATVVRDGFKVPLIGIDEEETQERCAKCGVSVDLMQAKLDQDKVYCADCAPASR